jgi:murein DD-endopeptidase MepM/ murein hydrolase activator NlpD
MPRRQVSVLVTNNYNGRSLRSTLSLAVVRVLFACAGLLAALVVAAVLLARAGLYRTARLSYLELRNRQLEAEFVKVAELRQRLERLEELERRYAAMLGVELTPPPVDWSAGTVDSAEVPGQASADPWGSRPVPAVLPVDGFTVSRRFGKDHPGVDLAAQAGTPVRATADGVVDSRGVDSVFGNYLRLVHPGGVETYYGHLLGWQSAPGDSVRAGQPIATVGSTGRSSAPHLHFEVRRHGTPLDPAVLLRFD